MASSLRPPRHDGGGRHRATLSTAQRLTRLMVALGVVALLVYPVVSYARASGFVTYNSVNTGSGGVVGVVPVDPSPSLASPVPVSVAPVPSDPNTVDPESPDSPPPAAATTDTATPLGDPAAAEDGSATNTARATAQSVVPTPRTPSPNVDTSSVTRSTASRNRTVTVTVTPANALDIGCTIENPSGKDVKLYVRAVGCFLDDRFPDIDALYGRRPVGLTQDHPDGVALDVMVGNQQELGDQIAACAQAHFVDWHITNILWQQKILDAPSGAFVPFADRGNDTANHKDHVHISFDRDPDSETPANLGC